MAKILTKKELLSLVKEVISLFPSSKITENWSLKLRELEADLQGTEKTKKPEPIKSTPDANPKPNNIAPGLKIKHQKTGTLYTIHGISGNKIAIRNPEGKLIFIRSHDLSQYKVG